MPLGIAAIVCACVALLCTGLGFMLTAVPFVGTILSFGAPLIALAGIVMGGIGLSRASKEGQPTGIHVGGLIASFVAFLPAVLVAITCGVCNVLCSAATLAPHRDGGTYPTYPTTTGPSPYDDDSIDDDDDDLVNVDDIVLPDDPTPVELARGVETLNELCPDTWCEGDFDYRFSAITCRGTACTVTFEAQQYDEDDEDAEHVPASIEVTGFDDVVACDAWTIVNGEELCDSRNLSQGWTEQMSVALRAWEDARRSSAP